MLGRKDYSREELDHARKSIAAQLAAYRKLVKAVEEGHADPKVSSALEAFEPLFFTNMTLVLDRYFVHRLRMSTGKDGNPLNEVELIADSLLNNGGILRDNNVIKLAPGETASGLSVGDRIRLGAGQFQRLSKAFFSDLEAKFVR